MASSVNLYLNWAKERIDEMNAVLASLEGRAVQVTAESQAKADELIADLRARRNAFLENMKKQAEAGEATWLEAKARLDSEWDRFQSDVKKYVDHFGQQFKQPQTTFQDVAAVQLKAWREAADNIQSASAQLAADSRAKVEAVVQQMKADASSAEANFQKLTKAGTESWGALNAALMESRSAFDRANQTAWDAFRRASSGA